MNYLPVALMVNVLIPGGPSIITAGVVKVTVTAGVVEVATGGGRDEGGRNGTDGSFFFLLTRTPLSKDIISRKRERENQIM